MKSRRSPMRTAATITFTLLLSAMGARAETVTLRADQWCPYNCEPDAAKPGYAIEVAREVFGKAGIDVDYAVLNWARSIEDARNGQYDGIIGALPGDAPDFVFPGEPIGATTDGFAVRSGTSFHLAGPQSFDGKVVGAVSSYAYGPDFQGYVDANKDDRSKLQLTSGDEALLQNLRKLKAGRLDIVVDDSNVLAYAITKEGLDGEVGIADRAKPVPIFIAFSPASPKAQTYAALLSAGIAQMRASGRLTEILARYNLKDWR